MEYVVLISIFVSSVFLAYFITRVKLSFNKKNCCQFDSTFNLCLHNVYIRPKRNFTFNLCPFASLNIMWYINANYCSCSIEFYWQYFMCNSKRILQIIKL